MDLDFSEYLHYYRLNLDCNLLLFLWTALCVIWIVQLLSDPPTNTGPLARFGAIPIRIQF